MQDTQTIARIRRKYQLLVPEMDERRRRQWAAAEAARAGLGRHFARGPGHRTVPPHDHRRLTATRSTDRAACGRGGTYPASWRGSASVDPDRPRIAGGLGVAAGTLDARRPHVPTPMDLQEHPAPGRGIDADEACRGATDRGGVAARGGIQPAGQPQDARRGVASRPQRPVRVHQRQCRAFPALGPTRAGSTHQKSPCFWSL